MKTRNTIIALLALVGAALAIAGPLNPPAGPVASTYKTLTEVEPRTAVNATNTPGNASIQYLITSPGSYYLTGNMTPSADKIGIYIASNGVTLDLNGFDVYDTIPNIGPSVRYGIEVDAGFYNVTIKNGSVRDWKSGGIRSDGNGCRFENITLRNNHGDGLYCGGSAVIVGCTAVGSAGWGFDIGNGCTLSNCSASGNTSGGFSVGVAGTLNGCSASSNTGTGFYLSGAVARGCAAASNNTYGFDCYGATVLESTSLDNAVYAIRANAGCVIRNNSCEGVSGFPVIQVSSINNRIEGNQLSNGTYGVYCPVASVGQFVVGNVSTGASSAGFSVTPTNNFVGPIITTTGTISTTSAFANFAR